MNTEYFTVPEVAHRYGVSQSKVYEMVNAREIGAIKIGRTIRISDEHLKIFEQGNNKHQTRVRAF